MKFQHSFVWQSDVRGSPVSVAFALTMAMTLVCGCSNPTGSPVDSVLRRRAGATPSMDFSARAASNAGDAGPSTASTRRHVIIMIGDGMQLAHEVATSRYLTGRDDGLSFHAFPTRVFKTTWDIDVYDIWARALGVPSYSRATFDPWVGYNPTIGGAKPYPLLRDNPARRAYFLSAPDGAGPHASRSSSTGTAMSTGMKTSSDNIAWAADDPPDGALETSAELLRRVYGMSIGFVTTGPITDATPAAWFAHNPSRDDHAGICQEMLTRVKPDVMIGGGRGTNFLDPTIVEAAVASGDYVYVERQSGINGNAALAAAARAANQDQKKLLALFGWDSGPYVGNLQWPIPKNNPGTPAFEPPPLEEPTFAHATVAALDVLSQNPNGFFAMFEQEDIDLASHTTDFSRQVGCVHDLDEAVKAVVDFVDRGGDAIDWSNTTLIVTADHANSYLRLETRLGPGKLPEQVSTDAGWAYPDGSVTYHPGGGHTNELVAVYVRGSAAARVRHYATVYSGIPDIIDDTSIYQLTLDAAWR